MRGLNDKPMKKRTGLALSGGGFRAAAFHLGTLRQLHQMGILSHIDVISSVSGGSITAAAYALNTKPFDDFERDMKKSLQKSMLTACYGLLTTALAILLTLPFVLAAWGWYWLFIYIPLILVLMRFQFNLLPFSRIIEQRYRSVFFGNKTLADLPEKPLLVINATNVETGRPFSFSRDKMTDSTYEFPPKGIAPVLFRHQRFPVSRAVMASSCVPFAFNPVKIGRRHYHKPHDARRIDPILIDGGVYDNQGIHKLTHFGSLYACDTVLVSDAGTGFKPLTRMNNTVMLLMQTSNLFMNRIKNIQYVNNVVLNKYLGKKSIAYFSLSNEPENAINYFVDFAKSGKLMPSLLAHHQLTPDMVITMSKQALAGHMKQQIGYDAMTERFPNASRRTVARSVGTNLTALTTTQINNLMSLAQVLTEIHVHLFCPELCNVVKTETAQ